MTHRALVLLLCSASLFSACGDGDSTGSGASGAGSSTGGAGGEGAAGTGTGTGAGSVSSCFATFDGGDVLNADVGDAAALTENFSLAARIRPEDVADGQTMFIAGRHLDGGPNGHYLRISNEGSLKAEYIVFIAAATCAVSSPLTIPASGEVHLLGSFDVANTRIFIDGNIGAVADCGEPTVIDPMSTFTIGRSSTGQFPFSGSITDVMYIDGVFDSTFDTTTLGCENGALVHYSFEDLADSPDSVPDVCGAAPDAIVGEGPGVDDSDPSFACE